jgi:CDP-diacylglycerol--glycerol-3-phosphate 3-phosphatidyltransferase
VIGNEQVNFPTVLTLIRLILSPLVLPLLLVYLLPVNFLWLNISLAVIFFLFSLTDFFDGYFARKFEQETLLGRILDPIADKFLMYSTLIALVAAGKLYFYWAILLIGREFFVMGLRLVALENKFNVHVAYVGKIKTAVHIICFGYIIVNPYQQLGLTGSFMWNGFEIFLIALSLFLSLASAQQYYRVFMHHFRKIISPDQLSQEGPFDDSE